MAGKKARVKANYASSSFDPLIFRKGDSVIATYESEDWPGWIWCINNDGKNGWAPISYLEISEDSAKALRDYNAAELTVMTGDELIVLEEESGWCWCEYADGEKGWVPMENLKILE